MQPLPPLTRNLMIACVVVYLLQTISSSSLVDRWFALYPVGSGFMPWQMLSYAFLHGGTVHLIFNMLGLWFFGADLERLWGQPRFWKLLLAATLTAAAVQLLFGWATGNSAPVVGSSGAIFGLLLAFALVFPRKQFDMVGFLPMLLMLVPHELFYVAGLVLLVLLWTNRQAVPIPPIIVPAKVMVLTMGGVALLLGLWGGKQGQTNVAHFAHLGGMLGAWLMLRYWRGQPPFSKQKRLNSVKR